MCALKLMFLKIFKVLEMRKKVTFHIKGSFDPLKSLSCFLMCFYGKQDGRTDYFIQKSQT